ncbi:hypothetical protein OROHE_007666 [Orobanche hederae]
MSGGEKGRPFVYTPSWVIAVVCFVIVFISVIVERALHNLGRFFKRKNQDSLYEALEKLKEELMILGFISLLLTVFQGLISRLCIPDRLASIMLPCRMEPPVHHQTRGMNVRRLLAEEVSEQCSEGHVPFLSLEALHQLHIFIFVLAVVYVIFSASTMVLGGIKISQWTHWEASIKNEKSRHHRAHALHAQVPLQEFRERAGKYWRKFRVVSWMVSCLQKIQYVHPFFKNLSTGIWLFLKILGIPSHLPSNRQSFKNLKESSIAAFFKQFYGSVTISDYVALRSGFIKTLFRQPRLQFSQVSAEDTGKRFQENNRNKLVLMALCCDLLAYEHNRMAYIFLAIILASIRLLLTVGAKLEHIITQLAKEAAERAGDAEATTVRPSDELFWFHKPILVLYLIHFILFQNSFEIAFFLWIWSTYGFKSCIMEELNFIIPRLVIGIIVQVLCSYSTLPLYALVSQMGTMFKQTLFEESTKDLILTWASHTKHAYSGTGGSTNRLTAESTNFTYLAQQPAVDMGITPSEIELSCPNSSSRPSSSNN